MVQQHAADASADALQETINDLSVYCGIVLLSFASYGKTPRETIARNFVARGMACVQSIFGVWRAGSEPDAWILHRTLIERLLHLNYLHESDGFLDFDDFSFASMYEARQKLLSDVDMKSHISDKLKILQSTNRPRYNSLPGKQERWHRPRAEDVAKKMGLGFLYRFGYDYASTHVHPMSDDGEADFERLIAPHKATIPDETVIRNSILIQTMLIQEALNGSAMRWSVDAYDFLTQVRQFLSTGTRSHQILLYKMGHYWPDRPICEPPPLTELDPL